MVETFPPQGADSGNPDVRPRRGTASRSETIKRAGTKYVADRCSMTAGSLAYHWFLALFPALIALLGLAGLAHTSPGTVRHVVSGLSKAGKRRRWPRVRVRRPARDGRKPGPAAAPSPRPAHPGLNADFGSGLARVQAMPGTGAGQVRTPVRRLREDG